VTPVTRVQFAQLPAIKISAPPPSQTGIKLQAGELSAIPGWYPPHLPRWSRTDPGTTAVRHPPVVSRSVCARFQRILHQDVKRRDGKDRGQRGHSDRWPFQYGPAPPGDPSAHANNDNEQAETKKICRQRHGVNRHATVHPGLPSTNQPRFEPPQGTPNPAPRLLAATSFAGTEFQLASGASRQRA